MIRGLFIVTVSVFCYPYRNRISSKDKSMNDVKKISTTSLAKELNISPKELFEHLLEMDMIARQGDNWELTTMGKMRGGSYENHEKYGRYIVWPRTIKADLDDTQNKPAGGLVTATYIGEKLDIPANRINSIFSEIGWIKKAEIKGWLVTDLGKRLGGVESRYKATGISFVRWPENIITNKLLITNVKESKGELIDTTQHETKESTSLEFREKFKPEHRAQDGHYVRSKSELIIDNWLYVSKIVHAYERKLPIEEEVYCDFYIPTGKVYIEYWGLDEEKYLVKKTWKLDIYKKNGFHLIELFEKDISNLDDKLPAKLLEFNIPVE